MKRVAMIIFMLISIYACLSAAKDVYMNESMGDQAINDIGSLHEEMTNLLDEEVQNGLPSKEDMYHRGEALSRLGKYEEAIPFYEFALGMDPGYYEAQEGMCNALRALHRCNEVADCYDNLIKIRPTPDACYLAGNALMNGSCPITYHQGDLYSQPVICYKAFEFYNKSVTLDENYADGWNNRGVALAYLYEFDESIECFDRATSLNSNLAEAWNNKGVSLDWLGRHNQSMGCYDQAIEIKPDLAVAWMNRATTLSLDTSLFPLAQENASRAVELDPSLADEISTWNWRYILLV